MFRARILSSWWKHVCSGHCASLKNCPAYWMRDSCHLLHMQHNGSFNCISHFALWKETHTCISIHLIWNTPVNFIHLTWIPVAYWSLESQYSTAVPHGEVYWLQEAAVCCNIKEKRWVCLSRYDGWPWAAEELIGSWWGWCCREKAYQARLAH